MSRQYEEYLEDIGFYESENDDTEWVILNERVADKRCDVVAINNKGYVAKLTEDGLIYKRLHKGDKHGHRNVRYVGNDGKHYEEYIHRLVAKNFIPNPKGYPNVLHYDDDPCNNNVNNLRWGTQLMNHKDSVRNGNYHPFDEESIRASVEACRRPIYAITPEGKRLYFDSIAECCRSLGLQGSNIDKVLKGERKNTKGYTFERADEDE